MPLIASVRPSNRERAFAAKFREICETNCPDGWRFAVFNQKGRCASAAGGWSRSAADPPSIASTVGHRQLLASMSKTLTAAAVLHLLELKGLSAETPVAKFLPTDWIVHADFQKLTVLDCLRHRTGIPPGEKGLAKHDDLKGLLAQPPANGTNPKPVYSRHGPALVREALAGLDLFDPATQMVKWPAGVALTADWLAKRYVALVNELVLDPLGIASADTNPNTLPLPGLTGKLSDKKLPMLCYAPGHPELKGSPGYDMLLESGPTAWWLSVDELGQLLQRLWFGEDILSAAMKKWMFPTTSPFNLYAGVKPMTVGNRKCFEHGGIDNFGGGAFCGGWGLVPQEGVIWVGLSNGGHSPTEANWGEKLVAAFVEIYGPG